MSQYYQSSDGGAPFVAAIETVTGNSGGPVGGSGVPTNINIIGDTAQGVSVNGNAGTFTETVTVQNATAAPTAGAALKGVSSFDSNDFTVTNGFVDIKGTSNGTGTTVGATTADIITVPLGAVAGVFQFEARAKGFDAATPAGCGYNVYATLRTDGVTATLEGSQSIFNENAVLSPADAYFIASGNNAVLQVLGVAGLTIDWVGSSQVT